MIATTIEQSKRLLELGLKPETADMIYRQVEDKLTGNSEYKLEIGLDVAVKENLFSYKNGYVIPAWSLSALLDIMPQHIDNRLGWQKFGLDKGWDGGIYQVYYENKNSYIEQKAKTAIDAAYEMVVWLLENGYIKKENGL